MGGIFRIGYPFLRDIGFPLGKLSATSIIAFYMYVREPEFGGISTAGRLRFGECQIFQLKGIDIYGLRGLVGNLHTFPDNRDMIV